MLIGWKMWWWIPFLLGAAPRAVFPRLPLKLMLSGRIPPYEMSERIVGGVEVVPNSIPFQIVLQRCGPTGCSLSCGGSVSDRPPVMLYWFSTTSFWMTSYRFSSRMSSWMQLTVCRGKSHRKNHLFLLLSDERLLFSVTADRLQVVAGDHKLVGDDGTEQEKKVSSFKNHADYNGNTFENDIALIFVSHLLSLASRHVTAMNI